MLRVVESLPIPDWNELFMRQVYLMASKSKDLRTKIGAILVKEKRVISQGYNGICRSVDDNKKERHERPAKYLWFEHGERNSIYNCAYHGIVTKGAEIWTCGVPCSDCARAVIQAGLSKVFVHKQWMDYEKRIYREKWTENCKIAEEMLSEAGVEISIIDKYLGIKTMLDGTVITV